MSKPTSFTAFAKSLQMGAQLHIVNYKLPHLTRDCELLSKTLEGILVTKQNGQAGHIKWPPARDTRCIENGVLLLDSHGNTWLAVTLL